jgi:tetratricopeptide (TPR) repeat protein
MSAHLDLATLQKLLDGRLADLEGLVLQRHLLGCPGCEERLIELLPPASDRYRELVRQVLDGARPGLEGLRSRLIRERGDACVLWDEIAGLDSPNRRLAVQEARYHTWGFFELLIEKARHSVLVEPRTAEEKLRLALLVAGHLDPATYGPGSVNAACARAYAYLGNALRVLSDFRSAEKAFLAAKRHLARSWMDPLDEALLLELEGSLRRAQRRFDEALELLEGAIAIYREINEPHLEGRALITKGAVLQYSGDLPGATACFRDSLFLLDGTRDPRLVVAGQFNLINCMFDSGRTSDAAGLIPDARQLLEKVGMRSDLLHLRWLEARVLAAQGQTEEAEQAFLEIRNAFTEDLLAFDAALVSLDLAALYAREGRTAQVQRMAREMFPIFQSCEVPQEALAALIVLQRAAEMEQLSLGLVEEVAACLQRIRAQPASPGLSVEAEPVGDD